MKRIVFQLSIIMMLLFVITGELSHAVDKQGDKFIKKIQEAVKELGYDPGPTDGFIGKRTREAISAFEAKVGLPVTGKDSKKLRDYLYVYTLPILRTEEAPRSSEKICGYKFHFSSKKQAIDVGDAPKSCLPEIRRSIAEGLPSMPGYSLITSQAGWRKWNRKLFSF